jgi:hypothetical protein
MTACEHVRIIIPMDRDAAFRFNAVHLGVVSIMVASALARCTALNRKAA